MSYIGYYVYPLGGRSLYHAIRNLILYESGARGVVKNDIEEAERGIIVILMFINSIHYKCAMCTNILHFISSSFGLLV
jgi:hypothetical protein